MTLHFFDRTLMDEQTACGIFVRHRLTGQEITSDPLDVDCRACHEDEDFLEALGRAEYAPIPPDKLSWRQKEGPLNDNWMENPWPKPDPRYPVADNE